MTEPQGQSQDGTLTPPTGHEKTEVKLEGLAKAEQPQPMEIRTLTMDEADLLRAKRAFKIGHITTFEEQQNINALKEIAYRFSSLLIDCCPAGKERSQALGQVHAAVIWGVASIDCKA